MQDRNRCNGCQQCPTGYWIMPFCPRLEYGCKVTSPLNTAYRRLNDWKGFSAKWNNVRKGYLSKK